MILGDNIQEVVKLDSEFSFLAYTDDIKIGPQKSNKDILLEITLTEDIRKIMTFPELVKQISNFTNLVYARFPRFYNKFKFTYRRVALNLRKSRVIFIVRYL